MINAEPETIVCKATEIAIKHNYVDFVELYGFDLADKKLESLFGNRWHQHKQVVWQWNDEEYNDR